MKFYGGSTAYFGGAADSFYDGGSLSALVPDVFTVSIGGRPYIVDLDQPFYRQYRRQIAPLTRTQADTSNLPGEHTLDPNGLWRRSFEDWSLGAGQRYLDRSTSTPNGFWASKGIDALTTKWQISLLPDVASRRTSSNTNLQVVAADGYIYICDGQHLLFTNSLTGTVTWTTVTGTPGVTCSSICTDGFTVYAAYGASGIYTTTAGAASASQYVTSAVGATAVVGYVNGRLMLGDNGATGNPLYNIVASGALPTALLTPYNPNTVWVGFASGNSFLYAAANVGGQGLVYGVTVTSDATALDAPVVEAQLPNGEQVASVCGYLGQLIVGTSLGVRYAQASSGGVQLGSLIPTPLPVQCLYGYGRWVWFGWTDYDTTSTGLGKIDLQNFVVPGVLPAYCSDRMAAGSGAVTGVVIVGGVAVFCVAGHGVYIDDGNLVASGSVQSGYVLYDLTDPKIASLLDVETVGPLTYGTYGASVALDAGEFNEIMFVVPGGQQNPASVALPGQPFERIETLITLNRDTSFPADGPTVSRWLLRSYPAPRRPVTWQLPLVLDERLADNSMGSEGFDPLVELEALEQMAGDGRPVAYQEADQAYQVYVQDVQFLPNELTQDKHYYNGMCLVTLEGLPVPYSAAA